MKRRKNITPLQKVICLIDSCNKRVYHNYKNHVFNGLQKTIILHPYQLALPSLSSSVYYGYHLGGSDEDIVFLFYVQDVKGICCHHVERFI
eukprot:3387736-Ditylum_brightwellii.AAC.1